VIDEVRASRLATGGHRDVDATDGVRVSTPDGWWLLRASNTQDVLVARAESTTRQGLDRLLAQIDAATGRIGPAARTKAHPEAVPLSYRHHSPLARMDAG
jgi:phosphomannomutase